MNIWISYIATVEWKTKCKVDSTYAVAKGKPEKKPEFFQTFFPQLKLYNNTPLYL